LQAFHHLYPHAGRQIGVFAVGFLAASPAGVPENIHVGCPDREAEEAFVLVAGIDPLVVLGPGLGGGGIKNVKQQGFVEGGRHTDGLGKHGDVVVVGVAVQSFAPPVEGPDAQPGYGLTLVTHQGRFLLQGQAGN